MGKGAIVVTGASGALGRQVAADLALSGEQVLAVGRSADRVRQALGEAFAPVTADATTDPGLVRALGFDVSRRSAWQEARNEATRAGSPWPRLGGAVLAAGGWRGGQPLQDTPDDTWQLMLEVNLETARASLAELIPELIAAGGGSVVVVGSRAALRPWESAGAAAYAAAKGALLALVQAVAAEVLEQGVRVNAVLPSTMDTPENRRAMPNADAARWVSTASMSSVIRFLLSDAARDVSGAVLPVYGRA